MRQVNTDYADDYEKDRKNQESKHEDVTAATQTRDSGGLDLTWAVRVETRRDRFKKYLKRELPKTW